MKPSSWDKQLGLASPLECAAIQSGQTNNPSGNETGLDASHHIHVSPEGRGKNFFLDILAYDYDDGDYYWVPGMQPYRAEHRIN
jgi:hypothetical protein